MFCLVVRLRINRIFVSQFYFKGKIYKINKTGKLFICRVPENINIDKIVRMIKLVSLYQFLLILSSLSNCMK